MNCFFQEKSQISAKPKQESGESWASFESARDPGATSGGVPEPRMPPGMDIANQDWSEQNSMPLSLAGATDVSADTVGAKALQDGYARQDMKGTDDLYTGEHTDLFYSDVGGFCERNNYCDRG